MHFKGTSVTFLCSGFDLLQLPKYDWHSKSSFYLLSLSFKTTIKITFSSATLNLKVYLWTLTFLSIWQLQLKSLKSTSITYDLTKYEKVAKSTVRNLMMAKLPKISFKSSRGCETLVGGCAAAGSYRFHHVGLKPSCLLEGFPQRDEQDSGWQKLIPPHKTWQSRELLTRPVCLWATANGLVHSPTPPVQHETHTGREAGGGTDARQLSSISTSIWLAWLLTTTGTQVLQGSVCACVCVCVTGETHVALWRSKRPFSWMWNIRSPPFKYSITKNKCSCWQVEWDILWIQVQSWSGMKVKVSHRSAPTLVWNVE